MNKSFRKQPYEEFPVIVDFSLNMETDEIITDHSVKAYDSAGDDVTTDLIDTTSIVGQTVTAQVKGGTASSFYTLTFKATTNATDDNKWQQDIEMEVC